jgi:hypothetical protein
MNHVAVLVRSVALLVITVSAAQFLSQDSEPWPAPVSGPEAPAPGEPAEVRVGGKSVTAIVTVGKQRVQFDGEKIVFEPGR